MIYFHKLLPLMLSPIALVLLLMVWSAFRRSRAAAILSVLLLYAASMPALSDRMFRALESQQLRMMPAAVEPTQAVVVLSGMLLNAPGEQGVVPEWGEATDRFFGALELYAAGKAPLLVFTGGLMPWQGQQEPEGQMLRRMAQRLGVPASAIEVSGPVQNTEQEASAVRQLLKPGVKRILLVTSAFHMPRAQRLFERMSFVVTPYPVDFRVAVREATLMDYLPEGHALWLTDIAAREWLGRAYYALRYGLIASK
jgi:uncharacterized SAM-binding protein YcdF (DUF218 family)